MQSQDHLQEIFCGIPEQLIISSKTDIEHLLCPICMHIVWRPVACAQNMCFSTFCQSCILQWLKNSQNKVQDECKCCPKCKRKFKKANIPLINCLLSGITFKCFYWEGGCKAQLPYDSFYKHLKSCQFKTAICSGCKQSFLKSNIGKHEGSCPMVQKVCRKCQFRSTTSQFQSRHNLKECLQGQLQIRKLKQQKLQFQVESLQNKLDGLQDLLFKIIKGQLIPLQIDFYTSFIQNFNFCLGEVRLIKSAWNSAKLKHDFLHFYITSPIKAGSIVGFSWKVRVENLEGNLLLGLCSTLCPSSVDLIINKFGQLKKKESNQQKYKFIRKQMFYFAEGDLLSFKFNPSSHLFLIENESKGVKCRLGKQVLDDLGDRFYGFYSMDMLNDCIKFL